MLCQQVRRIVIAKLKSIVYGQFLNAVLGENQMEDAGLSLPEVPYK